MARLNVPAFGGRFSRVRNFLVLSFVAAISCSALLTSQAQATPPNYKINPGDILQVTVWKEDGLDREVLVAPDGTITFPLVGEVVARGKTAEQLRADLETAIAPMIRDSHITVSIKAALGNTVSVIGQVAKPGELVLAHPTTVMQALSMAGGLTPYASEGRIIVLRHEGDKETAVAFPYSDVARGESLDSNIVLRPSDVVVVPTASLF